MPSVFVEQEETEKTDKEILLCLRDALASLERQFLGRLDYKRL